MKEEGSGGTLQPHPFFTSAREGLSGQLRVSSAIAQALHRGGSRSIPGHYVCDLWWTAWQLDRFFFLPFQFSLVSIIQYSDLSPTLCELNNQESIVQTASRSGHLTIWRNRLQTLKPKIQICFRYIKEAQSPCTGDQYGVSYN